MKSIATRSHCLTAYELYCGHGELQRMGMVSSTVQLENRQPELEPSPAPHCDKALEWSGAAAYQALAVPAAWQDGSRRGRRD